MKCDSGCEPGLGRSFTKNLRKLAIFKPLRRQVRMPGCQNRARTACTRRQSSEIILLIIIIMSLYYHKIIMITYWLHLIQFIGYELLSFVFASDNWRKNKLLKIFSPVRENT
jgi:hypothetical protein